MADEIQANYDCTENQLYAIAELIIDAMAANLADFTTHSPRFVLLYVTTLRGLRTTAMALPNHIQLKEGKMVNRVDLLPLAKKATERLATLKTYIIPAYPTTHDIMYHSAGSTHREEAGNKNWVEVQALFKAMTDFMTVPAHLTQLLLNNVMPSTFPALVAADEIAFNLKYNLFTTSKTTTTQKDAKLTANNALKDALAIVSLNAADIYANNFAKSQLFIFDTVKKLIAPPGSASLKVKLELNEEFTALPNIPVKIQAEGQPSITVITDIDGIAEFPEIDPTKYTITIADPTLIAYSFFKDVDTGVNAHVTVLMDLTPPPPPPPPTP